MSFALPWPQLWLDITLWTFAFNLNIEFFWDINVPFQQYIKFSVVMLFPILLLLLYKVRLNQANWHRAYVSHWKRTKRRFAIGVLLFVIFTILVVIVADTQAFRQSVREKSVVISRRSLTALLLCCIPGVLYLLWFLFSATLYRKRWQDPYFWYSFEKQKRRLALFFITITYLPIARTILVTYKCSPLDNNLETFPASPCISGIRDFLPIHYIAVLFIILYIFGIPVAFFRLIRRGCMEINRLYMIPEGLLAIKTLKKIKPTSKSEKVTHKVTVKRKVQLFKTHYATVVREYESAPSYLYQAYERPYRYFKIVQMAEKMILLVVSLFLISSLDQSLSGGSQVTSAATVLFTFTITQIIIGPFSDSFEDRMDQVSRLVNCLNVACGVILFYVRIFTFIYPSFVASSIADLISLSLSLSLSLSPLPLCNS
eukprot:TRINITY_DN5654_c0_g1_i4.p1 TRINITY_DN5654_c0_g1~~TRINITY_DN5654_c0_g1_i4.p1  ORF type:complete len:472 (-),score=79.76 TRINITY_DN5654_c0_g1_i4:723-2006(-)